MLVGSSIVFFCAAVVFGVLAWKTRRAEQRRSDARVAALATALDGDGEADAPAMFAGPSGTGVRRSPILSAAAGIAVFTVSVALQRRRMCA